MLQTDAPSTSTTLHGAQAWTSLSKESTRGGIASGIANAIGSPLGIVRPHFRIRASLIRAALLKIIGEKLGALKMPYSRASGLHVRVSVQETLMIAQRSQNPAQSLPQNAIGRRLANVLNIGRIQHMVLKFRAAPVKTT